MPEYLTLINAQVVQLGWFIIIPLLFLENIPIIGFIVPGVTVLFLAGFISSSINGSLFLFVACVITLIVADTIWYTLGRISRGKWRIVSQIARQSPNVKELLAKQPFTYLIFYQFIPYFRMFLPFALGMYSVSFRLWLSLVTISSILFGTILFGTGVITARYINSITSTEEVMQSLNIAILSLIAIYSLYLIVRYMLIRNKNDFSKGKHITK